MTRAQYIYYTNQREQLLADVLQASGRIAHWDKRKRHTLTIKGGTYVIEPLMGRRVADYRSRFEQLDAAVMAMLQREVGLDTLNVNLNGKQYKIEPTPEQIDAHECSVYEDFLRLVAKYKKEILDAPSE